MKYAVADISSSSLSVTIAERKGSVTEIVGKERESLSLLYYMDGRDLSRRGREKLIGALAQMKARLTEMGVGKCWLIATAALRHIGNFDEVADAVRSATGLVMNLIDGESEAYFDYVANECYSTCERAVLVDLGGKSMEVCALGGEKTMTCFDFGLLDLYEKFADKLQPDEDEAKAMGKYVKSRFDKEDLPGKDAYSTVILVGQTCASVYDIYAEFTDAEQGEGAKIMERKKLFKLVKRLVSGADRSRLILKSAPEKTHVILPAAVVIKKLVKRFDATGIIVSDRGVKEGYLSLVLDGRENGAYYDLEKGVSEGEPRMPGKGVRGKKDSDGKGDKDKDHVKPAAAVRRRTPVRRDESAEPSAPRTKRRAPAAAAQDSAPRRRGRPRKDASAAGTTGSSGSSAVRRRGRPRRTETKTDGE